MFALIDMTVCMTVVAAVIKMCELVCLDRYSRCRDARLHADPVALVT
jgi:hypothetical protein